MSRRWIIGIALVLLVVLTAVPLALAQAEARKQTSLQDVWARQRGKRGDLQKEDGSYIFELSSQGNAVVAAVGEDYVDFGNWPKQGTHRIIALERLELRGTP